MSKIGEFLLSIQALDDKIILMTIDAGQKKEHTVLLHKLPNYLKDDNNYGDDEIEPDGYLCRPF